LAGNASKGDFPSTDQTINIKNEITAIIDEQFYKLKSVIAAVMPAFNEPGKSKN
jgi:hypothetical protein